MGEREASNERTRTVGCQTATALKPELACHLVANGRKCLKSMGRAPFPTVSFSIPHMSPELQALWLCFPHSSLLCLAWHSLHPLCAKQKSAYPIQRFNASLTSKRAFLRPLGTQLSCQEDQHSSSNIACNCPLPLLHVCSFLHPLAQWLIYV